MSPVLPYARTWRWGQSWSALPELKENASRFIKAFIDIDIAPKGIVPTVGSMQAAFTLVLEDMAYLCMDFRKDLSVPFQPPLRLQFPSLEIAFSSCPT